MIGLGAADLRKRGATELHISIDFPAVCADSVRATRESPRWVRAEAAGVSYVAGAPYPAKVVPVAQRASPNRATFGSSPMCGLKSASHESVVPRRFSGANCRFQTII